MHPDSGGLSVPCPGNEGAVAKPVSVVFAVWGLNSHWFLNLSLLIALSGGQASTRISLAHKRELK